MKKPLLFTANSPVCTLSTPIGSKAPTEFRVFKKGNNETTKGDFLFDDKAAKAVMEMFIRMAGPDKVRRLTFDYDHGALQQNPIDPSKSSKSAGSCLIEVRDGELWAYDIVWTEEARKAIEAGEFIYFSPAFKKSTDNRPVWLINIAITSNPATMGCEPLCVAANILEDAEVCIAAATLSDLRTAFSAYLATSSAAIATLSVLVDVSAARPVSSDARNIAHPALTAALSWSFEDPTKNGWLGAIEDESSTWIAFVAMNGAAILWTKRTDDGLPTGEPLSFFRSDLVKDLSALAPALIEVPNSAGIPKVKDAPVDGTPLALASTDVPSGDALIASTDTTTSAPSKATPMPTAAPPIAVDFTALSYDGPLVASNGCAEYDYKRANARDVADCFILDTTLEVSEVLPDHPAAVSPLTGRYADPLTSGLGKWLGYIEPISKTWIAFVAMDGKCYLWTQRQGMGDNRSLGSNEGAGIGTPVVFMRTWETLSALTSRIASEDKDAAKLHATRVALSGAWAFYDSSKGAVYSNDAAMTVERLSSEASDLAAKLLAKGLSEATVEVLGVIPFRGYPVDDTSPWDPDGATHRLRMWASKDGSGDTGTIDFEKYGRGFAYCRSGEESALTGYVLPHHDVQHGELVTVKKAVQLAASAIQGTRVTLDVSTIPPGDVTAIRDHIASHYHQWGAKTPWESQAKEAVAMHAKLTDTLSKNKALTASKLKAKMLKAEPSFTDEECSGLFGEDEAKHTAMAVSKMNKALAVLDATMTDETPVKNSVGESASIVALGAALGMGLTATELDVVKGFSAVIGSLQQLNAMTGKTTIQESIAMIDKWREGDAAGKVAIQELSVAKKGAERAEALAVVARFESEGRLTPSMKTKAVAHFDTGGMLALNVYLEEREVIAGLGAPVITPHTVAAVAALNAVGALPGATTPQMAVDQAKQVATPPATTVVAATGEVTEAEVLKLSKLSSMMGLGKGFGKNPDKGGADYIDFCKMQLSDPLTLNAFRLEAAAFNA